MRSIKHIYNHQQHLKEMMSYYIKVEIVLNIPVKVRLRWRVWCGNLFIGPIKLNLKTTKARIECVA